VRPWFKYPVIALWLLVVGFAGPLAGKLTGAERNDATEYLPASAESTKVLALQADADRLPAVVVYERPGGLTDADRAAVRADAARYAGLSHVDGAVAAPEVSGDGAAARILVPLNFGARAWADAPATVDAITAIATGHGTGLTAYVTGPAGATADTGRAFGGINTTLLSATVAVVVAILLLTYRSPVLWLLPIVCAGIALTVAQAAIYLLAGPTGLAVSGQSTGILTVLVFGAGTDYALLLIARYREESRRHADRHAAMAVALRRAAPAIVASAATVAIGMLCLVFADTNSTSGMGPVAAVGIVVGLIVMLTLLPALLVTAGRWVFWPVRPRYGTEGYAERGPWARIGAWIGRRPRPVWIVTALALAALTAGVVQLHPDGLSLADSFRNTPDSVAGERVLAHHFPTAAGGEPIVVVARGDRAGEVFARFAADPGIDPATVTSPATRGGWSIVEGTLTAPADSPAAYDTVTRVRDRVHAVAGADARVGGRTATNLDLRRAARDDEKRVIPVVLAVVLLILGLLLRAVLAPVLLVATVVLSFGAALGASALVFRYLFGFAGAGTSLPLFVFVFLVALGIDYNIFLMTRVREESAAHGTRVAARRALTATGGVITSAGLVLAGTFATLFTLPLTEYAEIGFAVALGVLLDTAVVRAILVTALTLDLGPAMWWPWHFGRTADREALDHLDAADRGDPRGGNGRQPGGVRRAVPRR
jgi:RND superfamily putative drug exporter